MVLGALFYEGRYAESMAAYRLGQDRSGYSLAFDRYRQQVIGKLQLYSYFDCSTYNFASYYF